MEATISERDTRALWGEWNQEAPKLEISAAMRQKLWAAERML